jgi:hypothetical protein
MVRIRHGWLVAVIGLALPLATGCKKDDKKSDPAADKTKTMGEATAEKAPEPAKATDDLSLLPVDSEVVVGINIAQVQASPLWKQFIEPRIMTGESLKKFNEFKDKCGFDPTTAVKSMSLGLKSVSEKPEGAIVLHGVDKAKAWTCLDNMKENIAKDGTEYSRDGEVGLFKAKDGTQTALTFINDSTAIAVVGPNATAAGIKNVAAGTSALKSSPAFVEMYSKVNTKDSIWALVNGRLLDRAASLGVKPKAVFGSINVTDGLAMDVRMVVESAEAATQLATMAKGQVAQAAKMVDQVDVTSDGPEVKVTVVMSNQKLQALIAQIGGLVGAFGGGMGGQ